MFDGQVQSDFLKLVIIPDNQKSELIDFAAVDFLTLRNRLIDYIKVVYPLDYQNFSESDLGMMLVEVVAYMGAVTSMKADINAHENFLRTSKNRNNVKKLLELIGVTMRGPIGSAANAKLTLPSPSVFQQLTISPANRVVTISSPEDSGPLNFTLYKVVNGQLDVVVQNSNILLDVSESDSSTSTVWTNIALLEGALAVESGSFNNTDTIKQVNLTQSPVIEKSVEVFMEGDSSVSGAWVLVDNLYFASGGTDKIYQVVYNDDLTAKVIFGDGILGQSPTINSTFTITYRVGGGTRGNINSEIINTSVTTAEALTGVLENVSQATGGRDSETVEHAKKFAPYTFKRQDRLVTLEDYSTFATTFRGDNGSTGKARAVTRNAYGSANTIDVYLLQVASDNQLQQATISFKSEILTAMNEKKMLTDELVIVDGLIRSLDLVLTLTITKELKAKEEVIKGKARDKILTFFNVDNMDFGKSFILSELIRSLIDVDEIRFAEVNNLDSDVHIEMNEIIQLNNFTINVVGI